LKAKGCGVRQIGRQLNRSPSTISRELRRNAATRTDSSGYRAVNAQWHADRRARRPKAAKLAQNDKLRDYVQDRLGGKIAKPSGELVAGPEVPWIGRRHGRRADRRWARAWSPEQIANRLVVDFPHDESMRISHEAIYQALYVQGRGALRREPTACLRTGRALRVPRARTKGRGKKFVTPEVMICERPAEVADRAVPGHWEGDLIIGLDKSAIGTLVERTTRFTMLLRLPPMEGPGSEPRVKNGPPLAGHGAEAVRDAIADQIMVLPEQLRRSLTWDQGARVGTARSAPHRHGAGDLLRRPAQPLATRNEREHQRSASSVLPQRDRSHEAQSSRTRRRGPRPQHAAAQDARLEDARRSTQRASTIRMTGWCCDNPLNLSRARAVTFAELAEPTASCSRSAARRNVGITRSRNRFSPPSNGGSFTSVRGPRQPDFVSPFRVHRGLVQHAPVALDAGLLRITEIPHPRSLKFPTLNAVVGPLKGPPFRWRALRCWR
jgi:IS30 family transposase